MTAGKFNFTDEYAAHQNASFERSIGFSSNNSAWVISAYSAVMTVKKSHAATATVLSLTTENNRISFTQGNLMNLNVSAGLMSSIASGFHDYDLFLVSANKRLHQLQGKFEITPEV